MNVIPFTDHSFFSQVKSGKTRGLIFACLIFWQFKTPLDERLKAALIADGSFQSNQWQLQGVYVTTR